MPDDVVSIPTPDISHLTEDDYEHVYEPAEDSFILLDALEQDALELRAMQPALCLEIGLGSGVVSTFISILLDTLQPVVLGVDINSHACEVATRTAAQNMRMLEVVRSDLLTGLKRVFGKVDILVFNPPYVPTEETEFGQTQNEKGIGGAWAGGGDGMGLTNLVLPLIRDMLAPGGRFYLVAVQPNKPLEIVQYMRDQGMEADMILKRRAGREHLSVLRVIKRNDQ